MDIKKISECLLSILAEMGIYIVSYDYEENDIDLTEYISNSIDFITFFIEIEDAFKIDLPDELLGFENIRSLNSFSTKIFSYLQDLEHSDMPTYK